MQKLKKILMRQLDMLYAIHLGIKQIRRKLNEDPMRHLYLHKALTRPNFDPRWCRAAFRRSLSRNQKIHIAMEAVRKKGEPLDAVTVGAELDRRGWLVACGGHEYLVELVAAP